MRNPTLRTVFLEQSFQSFQFLLIIIIRFLDFSSFYGFVVRVSVFVAQLAFLSKHLFFLLLIIVSRLFCDERERVFLSFSSLLFFKLLSVDDPPNNTSSSKAKKIEEELFSTHQIPRRKKNSHSYRILNAKRERERLFERALIKG